MDRDEASPFSLGTCRGDGNYTDETRGRKKKLSDDDIDRLEEFLWKNGVEGRTLSCQALLMEAGIEATVSDRTIHRSLQTRDWRKCIAFHRGFVSPQLAERRVEAARKSLEERPHKVTGEISGSVTNSMYLQGHLVVYRYSGSLGNATVLTVSSNGHRKRKMTLLSLRKMAILAMGHAQNS